MRRAWLTVPACPVLLLAASALTVAQGPHADNFKAFNGTSLQGWQPQGSAQWRAASGAIVGAASGGQGWLTLDTSYQDLILRFSYQCNDCDAGVLLRKVPVPGAAGTWTGSYIGIGGPDAMTLSRLTLDAQGAETNREQLFTWTGRQNPQGMQFRVTEGADGWKDAFVLVRGEVAASALDRGNPPESDAAGAFGPLAFRIRRGTVTLKNVVVTDLLRPTAGKAGEVTARNFRKIELTDRYYSEGISAGDINRDGHMDALSGPYAYLGPDFTRAVEIYRPQIYAIARETLGGLFTDNWTSFVYDFTGDGWPDYLRISLFTTDGHVPPTVTLFVNPKGESRYWTAYRVAPEDLSSETTLLGDIDNDGKPELVMSRGREKDRVVGYLEPGPDATKPWTWVGVSDKARALDYHGHGYGYGDVNGDGRMDIIHGNGWWEQPAAGPTAVPWAFHAGPFGRGTDPWVRGADMFAYDVNADGLPDIVTSLFAHGPGLAWFQQQKQGSAIGWKEHVIADDPYASDAAKATWESTDKTVAFTDIHAINVADMDGDGIQDVIAGKKWFSHGVSYAENDRDDPAILAWYRTVRKGGGRVEFVPQVINNYVGLGSQIAIADMNKDGRPDVLTAARRGAYIFLNLK